MMTLKKIIIPKKIPVDLALRKFIISVAGKTLTGTDSREPVITATELQNLANKQATGCNNTTAKKEHRKDALKSKNRR